MFFEIMHKITQKNTSRLYTAFLTVECGKLMIMVRDEKIVAVRWVDPKTTGKGDPGHPLLGEAIRQLEDYFHGTLREFHLPIAPKGTEFQQQVWRQISNIPYGKAVNYSDLAKMVGTERGCRAVAQACGSNPIQIVVPCHRVVAANGRMGGYAAGSALKKWLLTRELEESSELEEII